MEKLADWPEAQQAQAALSSRGQLIVVEGSSHSIHWDHPEEVIAAIESVIGSAQASAADGR
jgi:pimeloyl-ACP methyl ester carboxylesterase